jgi:hypothetical protein
MFTKSLYVTPENGCVFVGYPNQNDITFCVNLPVKDGNIANVVTAVKHDGKYLQDMEGASVTYHRERMEDALRNVATLSFSEGIPEDYLEKLNSYKCEDFIVEYREECIVEV